MIVGLLGVAAAVAGLVGTQIQGNRQRAAEAERAREQMAEDARAALDQRAHEARAVLDQRAHEAQAVRDQRQRELTAERDERKERAKVTARLLLADLLQATNRLRLALRNEKYWSPRFSLSLDAWLEHRAVVARYMDHDQWSKVSRFYRSLGTVELQAQGARDGSDTSRPALSKYQRNQIEIARERGREAKVVLQVFSGDSKQSEEEHEEREIVDDELT